MTDTILLDNQPYVFTQDNLPCLITYGEKMGGSHISIKLVADLFRQGSKILFLTAYSMAKENFLEQVGGLSSKIACVSSVSELENSKDVQVIILESGNGGLFLESLQILSDLHERVVLIKNIEVFSESVFNECLSFEKIILSGNIDMCVAKENILQKNYKTIIAFNQPEIRLPFVVPQLEKYTGYLSSADGGGIITIQK